MAATQTSGLTEAKAAEEKADAASVDQSGAEANAETDARPNGTNEKAPASMTRDQVIAGIKKEFDDLIDPEDKKNPRTYFRNMVKLADKLDPKDLQNNEIIKASNFLKANIGKIEPNWSNRAFWLINGLKIKPLPSSTIFDATGPEIKQPVVKAKFSIQEM